MALREWRPLAKSGDPYAQYNLGTMYAYGHGVPQDYAEAAQRYYNGSVRDLNVKIEQFPSNFVAQRFDFTQAVFFELDEADAAARQPVKVQF